MIEPVKSPVAGVQRAAYATPTRGDRILALSLAAVTLAFYLRTLAPDLLPGDPGEFQFAAWRLGLAHPTGYPLYLLLGSGWQHLLAWVGVRPATALNLLSALLGAIAVALLYWVMLRWTVGPLLGRRLAALYSAVLLAANLTFWSQALIAEVYTLHACLVLALLLVAQAATPGVPGRGSTPLREKPLLWLAALAGLALTHHGMTLLLFPALALYLTMAGQGWRKLSLHFWLLAALAFVAPLLLYLYIPLRSGPEASPWIHQRLGDGVLSLYQPGWDSFITFLSGQSIAVGFRTGAEAWMQIPQAGWLWRYHFTWVGLALVGLGLFWLMRQRAWPILALTGLYFLLQQTFVLFYNIGDILVYYIPLYLVGAVWAGFGLLGLATGNWRGKGQDANPTSSAQPGLPAILGYVLAGCVLLWTLRGVTSTGAAIDQSGSRSARAQWEAIFAAQPPDDAILVSNDRNEIAPLFYFQTVERTGQGLTGLFPQIAPEPRFADIGATVETALAEGGEQPVYLIKPMPGLEVKYALEAATPPLVQVMGPAAAAPPEQPVDQPFGPLRLLGVDLDETPDGLNARLHWQVEAPLDGDYTATVQLLDADGEKLAQDDHPAGGVYYPTSLWKPGEQLVETHRLALTGPLPADAVLLVGMYRGAELTPLAPTLEIPLSP
jgi:hypothetical protein